MDAPPFPVGAYIAEREPSAKRRAEWIDVLEKAPAALREAVAGLSQAPLDTKSRTRTIRHIADHLADGHTQCYARFKCTLADDRPTIKAYDETRWSDLPDSRSVDVGMSLALLDGLHARWVFLLRSLSDPDYRRTFH